MDEQDAITPVNDPIPHAGHSGPVNFLHKRGQRQATLRRIRNWTLGIGTLLLTSVIIFFVLLFTVPYDNAPSNPDAYDAITLEAKKPTGIFRRLTNFVFSKDVALDGQKDDRTNILLLGMGGPGHDGPYLTDTIMLVSIKPSTRQIAMISIPRDLQVPIPGHGMRKINHINAFGEAARSDSGGEFARATIEKLLNVPIHYYIRVDFKGFEKIIDEVHGVKVNVERSFVDTQYPAPLNAYQTIEFAKGVQTMDGKTALIYARSRHGNNSEGSDFARARRQQKVLLALREKVLSFQTLTNPVRLSNIISALGDHISTNMQFSDMIAFVRLGRELDADTIRTLVLDDSPNGYLKTVIGADGAFLLVPKTGTFDEVKQAITGVFDTTLSTRDDTPIQDLPSHEAAKIEIQNGTWRAGLGARVKKRLTDKNMTIIALGNTTERPIMKSGIYRLQKLTPDQEETLRTIEVVLKIPLRDIVPDQIIHNSHADILILLGEDIQE